MLWIPLLGRAGPPIVNTDRGRQFTSGRRIDALTEAGVSISREYLTLSATA